MHIPCVERHLRTTLNFDDALPTQAAELSAIRKMTVLVRAGLEALIAGVSVVRLAALGGGEKSVRRIRRR